MTKTPNALKTDEVSISAATVDIKVMRVGSKQLTLAVFRQLERDDDIQGPMWGWVNYHPDKCEHHYEEHRHIIWQKGNELRRATRIHRGPDKIGSLRINSGWVCAAALEGWRPKHWPSSLSRGDLLPVSFKGFDCVVYFEPDCWGPVHHYVSCIEREQQEIKPPPFAMQMPPPVTPPSPQCAPVIPLDERTYIKNEQGRRRRDTEEALKRCEEVAGKKSARVWEQELRRKVELLREEQRLIEEDWQRILELPQLFIAV